MKNIQKIIFIYLLISCCIQPRIFAQETEKQTPRLDFSYVKKTDGSKVLKASLYLFVNRKTNPLNNVPVLFDIEPGSKNIEVTTNADGIAYLIIDKDTKLKTDKEGTINLIADFNGNDTIEPIQQEISIKDAIIRLALDEVDSVRTVNAQLLEIKGEDTIAAADQVVSFYVPRMFSMLKIAEETTDESGNISFDFPLDLPGNKDGTITVIARLDDNEVYANVEKREVAKWGVPLVNPVPESHRTLWTEVAPLWMIITLSIMLIGVWGHYIFTIIQLIFIKKESKNLKA